MKQLFTFIVLLSFITVHAQEKDPWTEYMTPTEVHHMLKKYSGAYDLTIIMSAAEGEEPVKMKLEASMQMILGGRFLELKQWGDMMGMAFEGITTIGYNTTSKKMELTAQTNLGTGTLYLSGKFDTQTRVANLTGELMNPVNKKTMNVLQRITFVSSDELRIENFEGEGDEVTKSIEYLFTRIK